MGAYLLAGIGGGCQSHSGHPLLLGVGVTRLDHQWQRLEHGQLESPGGKHHSISLYPEVRGVTALQVHRTTSTTVDKSHCGKQTQTETLDKYWPNCEREVNLN